MSSSQVLKSADRVGRESVRGGALGLCATATEMVLRTGSFLIIARLLPPSEFGLFAAAMLPVAILMVFKQAGFSLAIVQAPELELAHASRLFWINLRWNSCVTAVAILSIPLCVIYFGHSGLVPLALAGIASTTVFGTSTVHAGLLRREMRFGVIAAAHVIAAIGGAVAGVGFAANGAGAWALMLQHVALQSTLTACFWGCCKWRPVRPSRSANSDDPAVVRLTRFGRNTFVVHFFDRLTHHLHTMIVGGIAGMGVLGLYQAAQRWAGMPAEFLMPIRRVSLSGLCRLRSDTDRYRDYLRSTILLISLFASSVFGLITLDARLFIELVLGPAWLEATPFLQLFAAGVAADCLLRVLTWGLAAEGKSGWYARWACGRLVVITTGMVFGTAWGAVGVAAGFAIASWVYLIPTAAISLHGTHLSITDMISSLGRPLAAFAITAVVVMWMPLVEGNGFVVGHVLLGALYVGACVVLPGSLAELRRLRRVFCDKPLPDESITPPVMRPV